eukprot:7479116-Lingulodinium_polyedra.AAC.1
MLCRAGYRGNHGSRILKYRAGQVCATETKTGEAARQWVLEERPRQTLPQAGRNCPSLNTTSNAPTA